MEKKLTCRECRWSRKQQGTPFKGVCIAGSKEASAEETTSSVMMRTIPGRTIELDAPSCELFEPKPPRAQWLKEGF